jgi:hypothetical protein
MKTLTLEAALSYLHWRAIEEENDAEFLEECAGRFDAVREPFLRIAEGYRTRAENIRGNLDLLRAHFPRSLSSLNPRWRRLISMALSVRLSAGSKVSPRDVWVGKSNRRDLGGSDFLEVQLRAQIPPVACTTNRSRRARVWPRPPF